MPKAAPRVHWTRWTFQTPNAADVAHLARAHGMQIITWRASTAGIFTTFALWGTRTQMVATEEEWTRAGIKWYRKQPVGAEPAEPLLPRKEWIERWFVGDVFEPEEAT